MKNFNMSLGRMAAATAAVLVAGAMAQGVETLPPAAQPTAPAQTGPLTVPTQAPRPQQPSTTGQPIPAEGLQKAGGDGMPPAPRLQRAGALEYMNGGAGAEAREVIEGARARFTLHNVFSGKGGEYVVAEKVTVRNDASGVATEIPNAGPLLSIALPPGKYTIEAIVDGRVQKKTVSVAQQPVKLNWNWPGA